MSRRDRALRGSHTPVGAVVALWALSRLGVALTIVVTALLADVDAAQRRADPWSWLVMRFANWDSLLYAAVADRGYFPPGQPCCYQAFFPGFPMWMRWGSHLLGGSYFWAGFVLVQVAAAVAAVLLWSWCRDVSGSSRVAWCAFVAWALFPTSLFMTVVYTEAPFLCASLAAWACASRGRWWWTGLFTALAGLLRINAAFLSLALLVMWWRQPTRRWRDLLPQAAGPLVVTAYLGWLWDRTGRWDTWSASQEQGWDRAAAAPWVGLMHWAGELTSSGAPHLVMSRLLEGGATVAMVAVPVLLARRRRWPEAVLAGLNAVSLVCTTTFMGNARFLVVWFPAFLLLGEGLAQKPARTRRAWCWVSGLLLLGAAWSWGLRHWVA